MGYRGALLVPLLAGACAPPVRAADDPRAALLAPITLPMPADPTVRDVRFVPLAVARDRTFGEEPGGARRAIEDGVRVLLEPGGAVLTSEDRLPMAMDTPIVAPLPERLGGGFLFVVDGAHVWRADGWLRPARPIFTSRASFLDTYGRVSGGIVAGLDRVYAFTGTSVRSWEAFDGVTGRAMGDGPWPASPMVTSYAALDGWRAIALADLRGVVVTSDAGATWRAVEVPIEPRAVTVRDGVFEVVGTDAAGSEARYEVRDGAPEKRASSRAPLLDADLFPRDEPSPPLPGLLAAAVEDGWPAGDGTALVARDGALERVRLDDGTRVEVALRAYGLRPSRCHAIPLGTRGQPGFVCGQLDGPTILYELDPARGAMREVRRFDAPRAVIASGNGALAVRGPCAPGPEAAAAPRVHPYCVRTREGAWRELRIEGGLGAERVVVLRDGRVAIVSPPLGDTGAARLTVLHGETARTVPIAFAPSGPLSAEVQRVLDVGVWLDGFEERRAGVVGGWIEAAGTMLGVEVDLEGHARFGQYVRDAGRTMVSGRYGLGWTSSLLGLETTDGGMTWSQIDVPAPIASGRAIASRACGPIGCTAAGWVKVGWGRAAEAAHVPVAPAHPAPRGTAFTLPLICDAAGASAPARSPDPTALPPAGARADDERVQDDAPGVRIVAWGPKGGDWEHAGKWAVRWVWPFGGASEERSTIVAPVPPFLATAARFGGARTLKWSLLPGDDASHALLATHRKHDELGLFELEEDRAPQEIVRADGEPFGEIDAALRGAGRWYIATPARPSERAETVVWQVDGGVARELAHIPRTSDKARASLAWRTDGRAIGLVAIGAPSSWPTRWVRPIDLETGSAGDVEALGAQDLGDRASLPVCAAEDARWVLDVAAPFAVQIEPEGGPRSANPLASGTATLGAAVARVRLSRTEACIERVAGTVDVLPADRGVVSRDVATRSVVSLALTATSGHERRLLRCRER